MLQTLKPTTLSKKAYLLLSILGLIALGMCLWLAYQHSCCGVPIIWSNLAAIGFGLCGGLIAFVRKRKQHGKLD